MRWKRLGIFVIACLCSWIVVYFFLVFCPHCQKNNTVKPISIGINLGIQENPYNVNEMEVQKLESQVQSLGRDYNKLVAGLKKSLIEKSLLINKLREAKRKVDIEKSAYVNNIQNNLNSVVRADSLGGRNYNPNVYVKDNENLEFKSSNNQTSLLEGNIETVAKKNLDDGQPVIAVLVISCNRVTVKQCLDELLKWRPSKEQFPIIVSQDCSHQATTNVLLSYGDQITVIQQPDQSEIPIPPKEKKFKGYFKIARHYGWALNQIFFNFKFDTAIIVEDDLTIAPDFYEYFLGTYWLLKNDPTLWCVSAWNDNGKSGLIDESQPELLHRTDFFPGLGWMLTSSLWAELSVKWPKSYWDDWIRKPEQRKERACIRPEYPRTKTFGKVGVSNGMFFEKHLKYIKLNNKFVNFTKLNLSYLLKDNYDVAFVKEVYASPVVSYQELKNGQVVSTGPVRIPYYTKDQYKKTAKFIGLMDDFRSGVPRTAYRGVVTFSFKGRRVHLAPDSNWKAYNLTWS